MLGSKRKEPRPSQYVIIVITSLVSAFRYIYRCTGMHKDVAFLADTYNPIPIREQIMLTTLHFAIFDIPTPLIFNNTYYEKLKRFIIKTTVFEYTFRNYFNTLFFQSIIYCQAELKLKMISLISAQ